MGEGRSWCVCAGVIFFFQAEDGIRDLVRSRGLGDVYKRQVQGLEKSRSPGAIGQAAVQAHQPRAGKATAHPRLCLLYTSDAADERSSVDLGGRRILKKKKSNTHIECLCCLY